MKLSCKITIGVLIILLLLAVVSICLLTNFYAPGVHTFGKVIHYEVFESAYWVGRDGERTNLTVHGTYDGVPYNGGIGRFKGYLQVGDHPISFSQVADAGKGFLCTEENGYISLMKYFSIVQMDEAGRMIEGDYWYKLLLNPDKPEQIIICVYDKNNTPLGCVVNGSSYEEACQIYREYSDTLTSLP